MLCDVGQLDFIKFEVVKHLQNPHVGGEPPRAADVVGRRAGLGAAPLKGPHRAAGEGKGKRNRLCTVHFPRLSKVTRLRKSLFERPCLQKKVERTFLLKLEFHF